MPLTLLLSLKTLANSLRVEHTLRPVDSFESIRTARADDKQSTEEDTLHPLAGHGVHGRYRPEVFDVLQTLTGIRQREASSSTDSSNPSSHFAPEDDPRFVLWGTLVASPDGAGAGSDARLPVARKRMMIAASIERWVAQLTSVLDYDGLLNFFLTFRTYISAVDLCRLLICRFQW